MKEVASPKPFEASQRPADSDLFPARYKILWAFALADHTPNVPDFSFVCRALQVRGLNSHH